MSYKEHKTLQIKIYSIIEDGSGLMFRKVVTASLLAILLSLTLISGSIPHTSADIADTVQLMVSGTMTNSSNLVMPEARPISKW